MLANVIVTDVGKRFGNYTIFYLNSGPDLPLINTVELHDRNPGQSFPFAQNVVGDFSE